MKWLQQNTKSKIKGFPLQHSYRYEYHKEIRYWTINALLIILVLENYSVEEWGGTLSKYKYERNCLLSVSPLRF